MGIKNIWYPPNTSLYIVFVHNNFEAGDAKMEIPISNWHLQMGCLEWILLHLQVSTDSNFSCVGPIKESHCKIILENSMHKENFGNHMEDYIWRAPKSQGETHLRDSQSQVAKSWDLEARSRLPTLERGRGSSWEPRD